MIERLELNPEEESESVQWVQEHWSRKSLLALLRLSRTEVYHDLRSDRPARRHPDCWRELRQRQDYPRKEKAMVRAAAGAGIAQGSREKTVAPRALR